jgi:hypothetical protein
MPATRLDQVTTLAVLRQGVLKLPVRFVIQKLENLAGEGWRFDELHRVILYANGGWPLAFHIWPFTSGLSHLAFHIWPITSGPSHLHVHDVAVRLRQPVAHLQHALKTDLRFLHRHHGLLNADVGVVQAQLLLQML